MRLQLKLGLAKCLDKLGIIAALRRLHTGNKGTVLTFHRVLAEEDRESCYEPHLVISEGVFEELLLLLCREFKVVSLKQLLESPENHGSRQNIALTFDDGWIDTYSVAYPMLLRYEVPATVFLCTGLMGEDHMLPEERLFRIWRHCSARRQLPLLLKDIKNWGLPDSGSTEMEVWTRRIKKLPLETKLLMLIHLEYSYGVLKDNSRRFLTWDEARLMLHNGITFGSHTVRHSTLPTETNATLVRELQDSHDHLRSQLGINPQFIAYPNGAYNARVMQIAERIGFTHGFTTDRGLWRTKTPALAIPRINMDDSVVVDRSSRLHTSRARLHLQPFHRRLAFFEAHNYG